MMSELFTEEHEIAEASIDGENWFNISETAALFCINDHYLLRELDSVLKHYNKGHIVPVEYVLYRKKR